MRPKTYLSMATALLLLQACGGHDSIVGPSLDEATETPAIAQETGSASATAVTTPAARPVISSVTGPTWTWEKARLYGNSLKSDYLDIGAANDWTIRGKGFGPIRGTIVIGRGYYRVWVTSWSDTLIRARVASEFASTPQRRADLTVFALGVPPVTTFVDVIPAISTRPYGQCTWHVAKRRIEVGRSIPSPSAYNTNVKVDGSYEPRAFDVIHFKPTVEHTVFVESAARRVMTDDRKGNRTIRFDLGISQYNARYDEVLSTYATTHDVRETYDPKTGRVTARIVTSAPKFGQASATGVWR